MFNLFKKKKEGNKHKGDQYLSLKVREIVRETSDTVTLFFDQPEPYLEYEAGQYLTVILDIAGNEERRSYSLCTSPFVDSCPGITVKRVNEGLVSNYLNDHIRPGRTIEVMKPMGHFVTDYHSKNQRHFVMVAGGSGITPIMGISKSVLINEPLSKVTLIYCNRSEEQVIFRKELDNLQDKYQDRLKIVHNLTRPSSTWTGLSGRLDEERFKDILDKEGVLQDRDIKSYVCGPKGLMDAAERVLSMSGIGKDRVFRESFYNDLEAKEQMLRDSGKLAPELTRDVEVILEGTSHQFEVPAGKTILEAGLDQDIDMPYSCQSGLCTACRGRLLSGKVDMIEDAGLSAGEIEEGYILCCSSKPASGDVKVIIE